MNPNPVLKKLGFSNTDKVVILHTDDIGMCQASLSAFIDLWEFGGISSGAIMMPCPWAKPAAEYCRTHPGVDMGVHATITAEWVLVSSGSAAGTSKVVIDAQREKGLKVGLVKIRMYRPFPKERLIKVLKGRKAIGVLDRSICFGWNCGPMYQEIRALLPDIGKTPLMSFIDGIANLDITIPNIERMIKDIEAASRGKAYQETTWISLEE